MTLFITFVTIVAVIIGAVIGLKSAPKADKKSSRLNNQDLSCGEAFKNLKPIGFRNEGNN